MSSDHSNHDQTFVRTFAMVLAALGGIFAFCIFAASVIVPEKNVSAADLKRIEDRVKPIGNVITDQATLLAMAPPKVERAAYTGAQVIAQVCGNCHTSGVLNAPKIGDKAAWAARLGGDVALLTASAIKGVNAMPARGGNPDLSDDEIKAAVDLMIK